MPIQQVPAFAPDGDVHVIVESPRGTGLKLKYASDYDAFQLSRPLIKGVKFPYDWGFVPSTRGPDGDPLDAVVLWDQTSVPGLLLTCRLLGVLGVEQNSKAEPKHRERNDRIVAVPSAAPRSAHFHHVDDVPQRIKEELEQFFLASTALEHKDLRFFGWSDAREARRLIESSTWSKVSPASNTRRVGTL